MKSKLLVKNINPRLRIEQLENKLKKIEDDLNFFDLFDNILKTTCGKNKSKIKDYSDDCKRAAQIIINYDGGPVPRIYFYGSSIVELLKNDYRQQNLNQFQESLGFEKVKANLEKHVSLLKEEIICCKQNYINDMFSYIFLTVKNYFFKIKPFIFSFCATVLSLLLEVLIQICFPAK